GRRRREARRWIRRQRGRSSDHSGRAIPATPVDRRATSTLERRAWRHEPDRAAPDARVPGGSLYTETAPEAGRKTGHHRVGADPRPCAASLGRTHRARCLVRRASLTVARSLDPRPDAAGSVRGHVQGRDRRLARVIFFSGDDVRAAVSPERALDAVRDAFVAYARGDWTMPPKVYVPAYPAGDFRAMPALGGGHALLKWVTS